MPHACPYRSSWSDHQNNIWWGLQIMKLLIMQFPPNTSLAQIFSSAPSLQHPQPTYLLQCDRQRFTSIQYNTQTYSSVHFDLYVPKMKEDKTF
jgi:hypothetical protein